MAILSLCLAWLLVLTLQQAGVVNAVASAARSACRKLYTSLVVSGGVDCRRRWRNVYDKKPRRYAKYNRKAHLTASSDKSVTNNKRLYSTFCTVGANYWQTRSIARPLCDSRATCSPTLGRVILDTTYYLHLFLSSVYAPVLVRLCVLNFSCKSGVSVFLVWFDPHPRLQGPAAVVMATALRRDEQICVWEFQAGLGVIMQA